MNLLLPKEELFDSYINYINKLGLRVECDKDIFLSKSKKERSFYGKEQRIEVWIVDNDCVIGFAIIKPTLSIEDIEYGGNLFILIENREENLKIIFPKLINFIKHFYPLDRLLFTVNSEDNSLLNIIDKLDSKKFSESEVNRNGKLIKVIRYNVEI